MILFSGLSPFSGRFFGDGPSPLNRDTCICLLSTLLPYLDLSNSLRLHINAFVIFLTLLFLFNSRTTPSANIAQAVTGSNCVADYLEVSLKMDY